MNELERRLREAMQGALEQPPLGLLDGIRRRHRRHRLRVGLGCLAAVAVLAAVTPPAVNELRTAAGMSSADGGASSGSGPVAAPGTVLSGCESANPGDVGSDWASGALRAGPLYFLGGGTSGGVGRAGSPRVNLYVDIVAVAGLRPGSTVIVRVVAAGRRYLRFLYGPNDSLNPGLSYTMRSGESGVTFVACAPGAGLGQNSGPETTWYGGYLVLGRRCVPVDVWPPGRVRPIALRLGSCSAK